MRALSRHWAEEPPPQVLLRLIAAALGVKLQPIRAGWDELAELAADPRSGIAISGEPPV
jgi:hypothetical protein